MKLRLDSGIEVGFRELLQRHEYDALVEGLPTSEMSERAGSGAFERETEQTRSVSRLEPGQIAMVVRALDGGSHPRSQGVKE